VGTVTAVLALVVAAACAAIAGWLLHTHRRLEATVARLRAEIAATAGASAPALPPIAAGSRRLITVEILNPLELATTKSRAAGLLGSVTPATVTRIVYDQAGAQILAGLEEEGVVAEVRVHVAG
jgi:hypothetical protein